MRHAAILALFSALCGCGASRPASLSDPNAPQYSENPATALAFTPTIALHEPPIALWRDLRQPAAFVGFEGLGASFIYIRTDDRQSNDNTDSYLRQSIIEKTGVTYR